MNWFLLGIILTSFLILGSSRLHSAIRIVALQGAMLSVLPMMPQGALSSSHNLFLFVSSFLIKGVLIPALLFRSLRKTKIRREVEPIISLHLSLLAGGAVLVLAFSSVGRLALPTEPFPPLVVPAALTTVLIGFLLLISRTKALTQVIGFLVLDNGIFLFGITLLTHFPLTVEVGVLLDLLVGVFVMGIMIHHIHRTFDHIDTKALSSLRDAE